MSLLKSIIIEVLAGGDITKEAYVEDGVHVNSGFLDGLNKEDAINKMISFLEEKGIGKKNNQQEKVSGRKKQ